MNAIDRARRRQKLSSEIKLALFCTPEKYVKVLERNLRKALRELAVSLPSCGGYPIRRPKRDPNDYRGPRPKPGQTVMLCPIEAKMQVFAFTPKETLRCESCSFEIAREETQ